MERLAHQLEVGVEVPIALGLGQGRQVRGVTVGGDERLGRGHPVGGDPPLGGPAHQAGGQFGMRTMDSAIQQLFEAGVVSGAEAYRKAINKVRFEQFKEQA